MEPETINQPLSQNPIQSNSLPVKEEFKKSKIILILAYINVLSTLILKGVSILVNRDLPFIPPAALLGFFAALLVIFVKNQVAYKVSKVILLIYTFLYLFMFLILFYMFAVVGNG